MYPLGYMYPSLGTLALVYKAKKYLINPSHYMKHFQYKLSLHRLHDGYSIKMHDIPIRIF